ncbi:MAG: hypothetical protein KatS3mg109_1750 [Pirellulaceae bacterium]|nr:MAG: hypothetical protein KatS3mg109_1750 [Pirellulaceae bacterium]
MSNPTLQQRRLAIPLGGNASSPEAAIRTDFRATGFRSIVSGRGDRVLVRGGDTCYFFCVLYLVYIVQMLLFNAHVFPILHNRCAATCTSRFGLA